MKNKFIKWISYPLHKKILIKAIQLNLSKIKWYKENKRNIAYWNKSLLRELKNSSKIRMLDKIKSKIKTKLFVWFVVKNLMTMDAFTIYWAFDKKVC